jgi:hypothetical protein
LLFLLSSSPLGTILDVPRFHINLTMQGNAAMPDQPNRTTYVRETKKSGGATMAFIVGGLVVAVAVIAWLISGGDVDLAKGNSESSTTNVTIQAAPEQPAVEAPAVAPAPEGTTPAPVGN